MKITRRLAVGMVAALGLIALVAYGVTRRPVVQVVPVRRGDLTASLSATGVVESLQAAVAPKFVGRVEEVLVEEGDRVEVGQTLARLAAAQELAALRERQASLEAAKAQAARAAAALAQERSASTARIARAQAALKAAQARLQELKSGSRPQEVERARQAVAAAEAEAALAAADYERIRELHEQGAISRAEADRARTQSTRAESALGEARQQLSLLEEGARAEQITAAESGVVAAEAELAAAKAAAGQVEVLERSLAAARAAVLQAEAAVAAAASVAAEAGLQAPISGRVARRYVDAGDLAGPQSPAFLITGAGKVWVTAEVDEEDLALVYEGQRVEVTAESLAEPVPGTVAQVGAAAFARGLQQVRAKIVRCRIRLDGENELLRPGMEVDVHGSRTLAQDALVIPLEAIVESSERRSVFVVAGGAAARQEITVGRRTYREVEVTSGLSEGDEVVVSGTGDLRDGQRVRANSG
jgi:RND family efflux transporter MFP subunit